MVATIEIDYGKCQTPFECKKCLMVCPTSVFSVEAIKVEKFKETDPKEPGGYMLLPLYRDRCIGCMDCVQVCPQDALVVSFPEEVPSER